MAKKEPLEKIMDVEETFDVIEKKRIKEPLKYNSNTRASQRRSSKTKGYKSLVGGNQKPIASKSPKRISNKTPPLRKKQRLSKKSSKGLAKPKQLADANKNKDSFRGLRVTTSPRQYFGKKDHRELHAGVQTD